MSQNQASRAHLKAALDHQQDAAERLNIALSAAQMGTWDWDLTHQTQSWSPKAASILGLEPAAVETSYDRWLEQIHPDDRERVAAAIAQAQADNTIFAEEYRLLWPDQSVHWVLAQGRCLYTDGQPSQMIGVIQDITAAKQTTLAATASAARFRAVFEQAAVGMARLSPTGHWLQVNGRLCELLGYQPEAMIGQHFQQFTDPADQAQDETYYHQLMAGEMTACRFEKRYLHRDGTPVWTTVTVSTETDDQGQILALIAVIEDIRPLKQANMELQQRADELERVNSLFAVTNALLETRNSELDQFAYVASHDLKAPLRAIANLSEWLEEDLGNDLPEDNRHQLFLLRNRVHRMEALINGLLEYSRVGRRDRQISTVDVRQMLVEITDLIAPPPGFTIVLPNSLPHLETHHSALNQVFSNLISNAIKHHDRDDGTITVTAVEHPKHIEFAIQDDGPGIDPRYHQKIFSIFQTLKARDELESTGIGLAIVKKIIETEGGTITLESDLGKGTTFRFTWAK